MLQIFAKKKKGLALRGSKGFTLIELLVVIAIIGILASIVLVSMGGARKSARDAVRKADMRQMVTAQQMYYGDNFSFYQFDGNVPAPGTWPAAIGTYMPRTPNDPDATKTYYWMDNLGDANKEFFCAYAALETSPVTYYTASHGGNFTKTVAPTTLANCATP